MNNPTTVTAKPLLSDRAYLWLKNFAMVVLPGLGTLYFGLSEIWSLPGGQQVVGTCAVIATFLGILVKLGERSYDASDASNHVGTIHVTKTDDGTEYLLDIGDTDPDMIDRSGRVVFDVSSNPTPESASGGA